MNSTVSLSLDEYNALQRAKEKAEQEVASLREQIVQLRLKNGSGRDLTALNSAVRTCLLIARFAVANLPPETIKGWPFEALNTLADLVVDLPDASSDDVSLAAELRVFARECEKHERRRAAMPKPIVEEIDMRRGGA